MIITQKRNYIRLEFPEDFPHVVEVPPGGGEETVFRPSYRIDFKEPFIVYGLDFFFGHDRGDTFEMSAEVYSTEGHYLARRIEESDVTNREAAKLVLVPVPQRIKGVVISLVCRVTGASKIDNSAHPSFKKWRGNFDFNLILSGSY